MQQGGDRKSEDFKTAIAALISQPEAANLLNVSRESVVSAQRSMVASRLANLEHGQKKADTEISVSQPEAAELLNVSREYEGHDPIGFVLSLNLKRRHLDTAQRAMVASRLSNLGHGQKKADVEISTTQTEAANLLNVSRESVVSARKVLDQGTHELIQKVDAGELALQAEPLIAARAKARQLSTLKQNTDVPNLALRDKGETRDELSTISGVSARNISKVKNILESGSEDLVTQVRSGNVSINAAETIATLPKEKQAKMVARGKKEI